MKVLLLMKDYSSKLAHQKLIDCCFEYDKTAKVLSPLAEGTEVRIYNTKTSRWDICGRIISRDMKTGRSYRVLTNNDVYILRNRRFIKPISRFDHRTKPLGGHVRWESMGNYNDRLRGNR